MSLLYTSIVNSVDDGLLRITGTTCIVLFSLIMYAGFSNITVATTQNDVIHVNSMVNYPLYNIIIHTYLMLNKFEQLLFQHVPYIDAYTS